MTSCLAQKMSEIVVLLSAAILCLSPFSHGTERHSLAMSLPYMDTYVRAEIEFVKELRGALETIKLPGKVLAARYLANFEESVKNLRNYNSSQDTTERAKAVMDNPLAIFVTVWRYFEYMAQLKTYVGDFKCELLTFLGKRGSFIKRDLDNVTAGIVKICRTHNLEPALVAEGILAGVATGVKLNAKQCLKIGRNAGNSKYYTVSIPFLELAASKAIKDPTIEETEVEQALTQVIAEHDKLITSGNATAKERRVMYSTELGPLRERYPETYTSVAIPQRVLESTEQEPDDSVPFFDDICAKRGVQSENAKSKLFCWLETSIHPYWYINPLKIEMLSRATKVVQIYDMMSEKQQGIIKDLYMKGKRSRLNSNPQLEAFYTRETTVPGLETLAQSVEKFTGLRATRKSSTRPMRIVAYGPGTSTSIHLDQDPIPMITKKHVAAAVLYIVDAGELGGETGYFIDGFTTRPVSGSLIYFFTMHRNGRSNEESFHGGCPLILGRKWLAGKWLKYVDQFQHLKCGRGFADDVVLFPKSKTLKAMGLSF